LLFCHEINFKTKTKTNKMKTKKLLIASIVMLGATTFFTSCSKDKDEDPIVETPVPTPDTSFPSITVSGNITSNTTWTKDKIVYLDGRVIVTAPAELTIEAGTVIKGKPGSDANAAVLVIGVGAKIHASGTATSPIIFTSSDDQITPGQVASPNLTINNKGLWGGVVVLGDAPCSTPTGGTAEIEGIPAGTAGTTYGGTDATDNSGELQYISIRHGGVIIGAGNELNGLTLGGVGSGTTVDHIEVFGNLDDGIELFGGTVNVSHAIVVKIDDDSYDVDQAWSGTVTNFVAVIGENQEGDAFEIDGPEGSLNATGVGTFTKGYVVGQSGNATCDYAVFKSKAQCNLQNTYFTGFNAANKMVVNGIDAYNNHAGTGTAALTISNNVFNVATLTGLYKTDQAGDPSNNTTKLVNDNTVGSGLTNGFDPTQFVGWTIAGRSGQFRY
jgi:hypothetical protein